MEKNNGIIYIILFVVLSPMLMSVMAMTFGNEIIMNEKETIDDFVDIKIYPTENGWKVLRKALKENHCFSSRPKQWEESFEHYKDESDGSFLISMKMLNCIAPNLLINKNLLKKKSRIVKSRMKKFLEFRGYKDLDDFKNSIAVLVCNEPI